MAARHGLGLIPVQYIVLDKSWDAEYERFILLDRHTLLYASCAYRNLLESYLKAEPIYLGAVGGSGKLAAVLPAFLKNNERYGAVLNSLPFYGSNGGIIEHHGDMAVRREMLAFFDEIARQRNCAAATIITSPFEQHGDFYRQNMAYDFTDQRIGQITPLPERPLETQDEYIKWVPNCKTRNVIRKAMKSGVNIYESTDEADLKFLVTVHHGNISALGGLSKEASFFREVFQLINRRVAKLYVATIGEEKAAALLLFQYNKTVEYFTPSLVEKFRSCQPLSLLILQAMKDATERGYQYWNWGGTWLNQGGVYGFKKKWGTVDYPYFYYTKLHNKEILRCGKETLLHEYPNFFVLPFNKLQG